MSNLKQCMDIIGSTEEPHVTFQGNTLRTANSTACLFMHALALSLIWAISTTSIVFSGEATTSTHGTVNPMAAVLSTKIIVRGSDNQGETESFVFEVPKAGEAVLRLVNRAKKGTASSERVRGVKLTPTETAEIT